MAKHSELQHGPLSCQSPEALDTREFLTRVADKWSILVVVALAGRPRHRARFSELLREIGGVSDRMLTTTLRNLERDGMLVRELFPEVPPRVEYELTPLGLKLLEPLRRMADWVIAHWGEVKHARAKFDAKQPRKRERS